jgi:hypothetical protein
LPSLRTKEYRRSEASHTSFKSKRESVQIKTERAKLIKTTAEIRTLLSNAKLDFETVENKALNEYLPKIFHICPFTEEICTTKQCMECPSLQKHK